MNKKEEEYFKKLGLKIRFLRQLKRLSQLEFAINCGIGRTELYKVEKGLINPRLETITKIAKGFGITIDNLLNVEEIKRMKK